MNTVLSFLVWDSIRPLYAHCDLRLAAQSHPLLRSQKTLLPKHPGARGQQPLFTRQNHNPLHHLNRAVLQNPRACGTMIWQPVRREPLRETHCN